MATKKRKSSRTTAPRARARAPASIVPAPAPAAPKRRRRNAAPKDKSNTALKGGLAALIGGAGGALAGGLLVKAGVKPMTAAVGITVAGAVGTFTLDGTARAVSAGVASSGAGQLALGWLATVRNEMPTVLPGQALPAASDFSRNESPTPPELDIIDIDDAFEQARNQFHEYDDEGEDDEDDVVIHMEAAA